MNDFRLQYPFFVAQQKSAHPVCYLDNAATTHKPQSVIDALVSFYTHHNASVGRGTYELAEAATKQFEAVRVQVAQFIGAESACEIIFTSGTTHSINTVASSWAEHVLCPGDEILLSQLEHHANLLPWQQVALKTGAVLRFIPVLPDGTLDMVSLDLLITDTTKLVAVTHISNAIGTVVDIQTIIKKAKKVGARVLIDAAQSVAHVSIDVKQLECDFLTFSAHKMGGPTGVGVLYAKKDTHADFKPHNLGGGMVLQASFTHFTSLPVPYLLEGGTPPVAQVIGLGAAITHLQNTLCFKKAYAYQQKLIHRIIAYLKNNPQFTILGTPGKSHIISFCHATWHAHDIAAFLDSKNICVRAGNHCAQPLAAVMGYAASVRVSVYHYTTDYDIDCLLAALHELQY